MSALRMAELVLNRAKERIEENRTSMEKGVGHDQYMKLCGRVAEDKWIMDLCREFLAQVEGEDEADEL